MSDTKNSEQAERPTDRLTVTVGGEAREIFMSGGLIRRLVPLIGSVGDFADVFTRPDVQEAVIVECLRPRSVRGQAAGEGYTLEDFEIGQDDCDRLISWTTEHVLHFFVANARMAKGLVENNKQTLEEMQSLMQSPDGSQASAESTPSVGA